MALIDWVIVGVYVLFAVFIGVYFSKRASKNATEFFVAGRSLPWWIAGTSMVATTFSSDTPLFVAAASREDGVAANWIWWSALMANLATVFFFAKLWRRSEALTEVEFIRQRYGGGPFASALRIFRALFDGVFLNGVIMASVTLAMSKVIVVILDLPPNALFIVPGFGEVTPTIAILLILGLAAVVYTGLSGLYGVVYTDLVQFGMAMVGAFALMAIVYVDLSAGAGLANNLEAATGFSLEKLEFFPTSFGADLATFTFVVLVLFSWLSTASGPGFFIQRTLAARSERDAVLSVYWFTFCHYVLRSWPWIFIGIASLVYFPTLADSESAYPLMIDRFLPTGLKGIMVASLLAAFMSTLDTHINWGTSYVINDIYRPFIVRGASEKHYVLASRIAMLVLTVFALVLTTKLSGILAAYKYIIVMMGGIAFVLIARWYWWRINVWSELSSLICALLVGNLLFLLFPDRNGEDLFTVRLLANMTITAIVCIGVTLITSRKEPPVHVIDFYNKLRIAGPGWRKVRAIDGVKSVKSDNLAESVVGWLASIAFIYAMLFAVGYALFHHWHAVWVSLAIAVAAGAVARRQIRILIDDIREG